MRIRCKITTLGVLVGSALIVACLLRPNGDTFEMTQTPNPVVHSTALSPVNTLPDVDLNQNGKPEVQIVAPLGHWLDDVLELRRSTREIIPILHDRINDQLPEGDVDRLFALMCKDAPDASKREEWYVIVNEVMETLRRRAIGSDRYTTELSGIIDNADASEVVRDYAVQHLSQWLVPAGSDLPGESRRELIPPAIELFARILEDPSLDATSLPGTTVLCLADICERLDPKTATVLWTTLEPSLQAILDGKRKSSIASKVSALQAVSLRGLDSFYPVAVGLAGSESTEPSVRLSAIAALGNYRRTDQLGLLQKLAANEGPLRYAALESLKKIEQSNSRRNVGAN